MTAKVLVAEKIADDGIERLLEKGYEVDELYGLSPAELLAKIGGYDALIVRSNTQVTAELLNAASRLKIVGRAGVTVDNIDIPAATEKGIIVCNAPTSNTVSTAEHTMALMLACARFIPQANASMKAGRWDRAHLVGRELYGSTLAIFGLGRIGGLVAERARAFGMHLIGYDPYCRPERAEALGVKLYSSIEDILPQADFISVHMPKTLETIDMFGPDEFAAMKDGVVLINTARGGIYNLESLADFIAAGKIGAVAIDMFEEEPCLKSPLHDFENVILTPRIASATVEAQRRASLQIADDVISGLEGSLVATALNLHSSAVDAEGQIGPYVAACQMMGRILAQLAPEIPRTLEVTAAGTLMGADLSVLLAGALSGILSYKSDALVTPANAETIAHRHGITASARSEYDAHEYASTVTIVADDLEIAAMISSPSAATRLVSLRGYRIDLAPAKHCLIFEYGDTPGKLGIIGTVLGEENINITTMQIGTSDEGDNALVFMNVDTEVPERVLIQLEEKISDLKNIWSIKL